MRVACPGIFAPILPHRKVEEPADAVNESAAMVERGRAVLQGENANRLGELERRAGVAGRGAALQSFAKLLEHGGRRRLRATLARRAAQTLRHLFGDAERGHQGVEQQLVALPFAQGLAQ